MCATDEGHDKGEKWCKRAIWQNTLPDIKRVYKSVDNLTSAAFIDMWRQRLAMFYCAILGDGFGKMTCRGGGVPAE